jgi:5-methylcytosine-specific restriction endonuclease McrA
MYWEKEKQPSKQIPLTESRKVYRTNRWKEISKRNLRENPLCVMCKAEGKIVAATETDHIIPISKGGDPWAKENLQSLCKPHNRLKVNTDHEPTKIHSKEKENNYDRVLSY